MLLVVRNASFCGANGVLNPSLSIKQFASSLMVSLSLSRSASVSRNRGCLMTVGGGMGCCWRCGCGCGLLYVSMASYVSLR